MSLFGGFFGDDDPFFGGHMRQMNRMMDPFDMFGGFPGLGGRARSSGSLMPFGFPDVNMMMDNFKMGMGNPNCHSFSQSTVMTMSSGPDGTPRIYQESHSTRTAPGGIKETKKAVCDSRTGTKRLAIGRHIGERGHVRERVENFQSGEREETEDYINLEEEEADQFNREWQHKSRDMPSHRHASIGYRDRSDQHYRPTPAIMPSSSPRYRPRVSSQSYSSRRPMLAITHPSITEVDDDDDEVNVIAERPRKRPRETSSVTIEEIETNPTTTRPTKKSSKSGSRRQ